MDLTKEYQNMLKAAPEIQAMWKKEMGDFVYMPQYGKICTIFDGADGEYTISMHHISKNYRFIDKCTWLPKQDQLQDMININEIRPKLLLGSSRSESLIMGFQQFLNQYILSWTNKNYSIEQLLLMFVINTEFHKYWTGTEWIKEHT